MISDVIRGFVSSTKAEIRAPKPMRGLTSAAAVECSSIALLFIIPYLSFYESPLGFL
jgi:hypothetical protein